MIEPTKDEEKWIERFKKVVNSAPPGVWCFVGSSGPNICVMRCGANGEKVMSLYGGFDPDYILEGFDPDSEWWDGGDW